MKTMYHKISKGETKRRTLHNDDIDGITYLFPSDDIPHEGSIIVSGEITEGIEFLSLSLKGKKAKTSIIISNEDAEDFEHLYFEFKYLRSDTYIITVEGLVETKRKVKEIRKVILKKGESEEIDITL